MSDRPRVEVVVANWKRPANIPRVLEALRAQTVPVTCTLTDASPEAHPAVIHDAWDRVFTMPNMGAWNRIAICGAYGHEYTLFVDDDVIPAPNMVERFLSCADALGDRFACLGFRGRRYKWGTIEIHDFPQMNECMEWIAQIYFLKTRDIYWTLHELHRCGLKVKLPSNHFDAIMCYGITRHTGQPCYVIPQPDGMSYDLPENDAVSKNEGYEASLIQTIERLKA